MTTAVHQMTPPRIGTKWCFINLTSQLGGDPTKWRSIPYNNVSDMTHTKPIPHLRTEQNGLLSRRYLSTYYSLLITTNLTWPIPKYFKPRRHKLHRMKRRCTVCSDVGIKSSPHFFINSLKVHITDFRFSVLLFKTAWKCANIYAASVSIFFTNNFQKSPNLVTLPMQAFWLLEDSSRDL